jgi:hypothetical protein
VAGRGRRHSPARPAGFRRRRWRCGIWRHGVLRCLHRECWPGGPGTVKGHRQGTGGTLVVWRAPFTPAASGATARRASRGRRQRRHGSGRARPDEVIAAPSAGTGGRRPGQAPFGQFIAGSGRSGSARAQPWTAPGSAWRTGRTACPAGAGRAAVMRQPAAPVAGAAFHLQEGQAQDVARPACKGVRAARGGDGEDLFVHEFQVCRHRASPAARNGWRRQRRSRQSRRGAGGWKGSPSLRDGAGEAGRRGASQCIPKAGRIARFRLPPNGLARRVSEAEASSCRALRTSAT